MDSLDEFKSSIDDIMKELETNPDKINDMTDEQVIEIEKRLNPYGATIYGPEKYTCISFTNLREKYMTKLLTTGLIGYTYQMKDEYTVEEEDLNVSLNKDDFMIEYPHPDSNNKTICDGLYNRFYCELKDKLIKTKGENHVLTDDEEIRLSTKAANLVKKELNPTISFNNDEFVRRKEELIKEQSDEEKKVIERFLNKLFKYNPNLHSKPAFKPNHDDPERTSDLQNEFTKTQPPNDTYCRFAHYYETKYEEIRNAVQYLYSDKPDIEVAINIFDTFDTVDECNKYIEKNKDNVICNLLNLTNYKWNLLGSFKKNRERVTFYNKNTVVLENILKQQEEDAKMGKSLLNDRVRKKKAKNIKEYGKEHPNFQKYKKENPTNIISSTEDKIVVEENVEVSETGAELDEDGTPKDCIEIGVTSVNAKTGKVNTGKIFTKAKAPDVIDE